MGSAFLGGGLLYGWSCCHKLRHWAVHSRFSSLGIGLELIGQIFRRFRTTGQAGGLGEHRADFMDAMAPAPTGQGALGEEVFGVGHRWWAGLPAP